MSGFKYYQLQYTYITTHISNR